MEQSLFFKWLKDSFVKTIDSVVNKINGKDGEPTYLFMSMLTKKFSVNLKWGSLNTDGRTVAADIVAMDASVPLKKRDSFGTVEGDVPKIGMKMRKSEREMQDIQILEATNTNGINNTQILELLYNDPVRCLRGVYEKVEYMFHELLSTGVTTISEDINTGTAVRINSGLPDSNKFGTDIKWSDISAKPISDIERIMEKARDKGKSLLYMMMDRKSFNNFKTKAEVKELYAAGLNFSGANIPTPNLEQVNTALSSNNLPTIVIIDRTVNIEKNGVRTVTRPWAENAVVFTSTITAIGDLVWSRLVEASNQAKDVTYAVADDYVLLSEFHTKDPFSETVSSQALVVPVLNNVDGIFILNSEEATASEDAQTEGDANFSYKGTNYTKTSVVAGLNKTEEVPTSTTSQQDATLASKIDKLSEEGVSIFEAELVTSV